MMLRLLTLTGLVLLTGCISRQEADRKLVNGCVAGVREFIVEPDMEITITGPDEVNVGPSELGEGFREVSMTLTVDDGWYQEEKHYGCVFRESFGAFNMSHDVVIQLVDLGDGRYIGSKDGLIRGDIEDHVRLTNAVSRGLLE